MTHILSFLFWDGFIPFPNWYSAICNLVAKCPMAFGTGIFAGAPRLDKFLDRNRFRCGFEVSAMAASIRLDHNRSSLETTTLRAGERRSLVVLAETESLGAENGVGTISTPIALGLEVGPVVILLLQQVSGDLRSSDPSPTPITLSIPQRKTYRSCSSIHTDWCWK